MMMVRRESKEIGVEVERLYRPPSLTPLPLDIICALYMMTHLHPPTSSSPLDLVREGFSLFVLGSSRQLGPCSDSLFRFSLFYPGRLGLSPLLIRSILFTHDS